MNGLLAAHTRSPGYPSALVQRDQNDARGRKSFGALYLSEPVAASESVEVWQCGSRPVHCGLLGQATVIVHDGTPLITANPP